MKRPGLTDERDGYESLGDGFAGHGIPDVENALSGDTARLENAISPCQMGRPDKK